MAERLCACCGEVMAPISDQEWGTCTQCGGCSGAGDSGEPGDQLRGPGCPLVRAREALESK